MACYGSNRVDFLAGFNDRLVALLFAFFEVAIRKHASGVYKSNKLPATGLDVPPVHGKFVEGQPL